MNLATANPLHYLDYGALGAAILVLLVAVGMMLRVLAREALARNAEAAARIVHQTPPKPAVVEISGNGSSHRKPRYLEIRWHVWNGRHWERVAISEGEE